MRLIKIFQGNANGGLERLELDVNSWLKTNTDKKVLNMKGFLDAKDGMFIIIITYTEADK